MQGKKGDIASIIVFICLMLVIAISFLCYTYIFHSTATIFAGTPLGNYTEGKIAVETMDNFGTHSLQNIFLWIFGGMLLALMLSSFFVNTHPVFLVIYIMLLVINLFIAIFASNAYQMINVGELASTYASQTITKTIMENLVRITLVAEALSLILLFARMTVFNTGSGGGGNL